MKTPEEIAQAIISENGSWMVSQVGESGLDDLIWDLYEPYQHMDSDKRAALFRAVAKELFG